MVKGRGKGVDDNQDPKVGRITELIEGKRRLKHVARKGATKKKIASNTSEPASSARVGVKRQQPNKTKRKTKPQTKKFKSGTLADVNVTTDLRIVKCLVDVDEIRAYNWSKYVLDRLCEAVRKYKNGDLDYFTGCVMLLQLIYVYRLKFRNKEVDCSLPLVQHWTDENVKDRVSSETKAVCFGRGCLDTTTYPVSKKLHFVDGQVIEHSKDLMDEVNYKGKEKSSEGHAHDFDAEFSGGMPHVSSCQQSITFPLPLGAPSTEEILSRESDLNICEEHAWWEVMVWLHPNFIIHRDDMVSIGSNSEIFCCVIDCWALMLNENERRKKGGPVKFFFNVSQSADQVSTFFDGMGLVNVPYIIDYPMEFVTLNWKSSKQNVDCGLYVMMSMLLFDGSDEFSYDNLKTAPMRRVLRAKICAALVLSDRNDVRSEILDEMKAMRPSRPQLQKEVEQRRKQEIEDLKMKEYAAKRAAKKNWFHYVADRFDVNNTLCILSLQRMDVEYLSANISQKEWLLFGFRTM
ncbi:ATP synthase subunit b [Bienertia sinuspersici]